MELPTDTRRKLMEAAKMQLVILSCNKYLVMYFFPSEENTPQQK